MSNFAGLYDVRFATEKDHNFILATFLRGLYHGDSWFSLIPKDIFMSNYKNVALNLINSPKVVVNIACLKEDPDVIIGYSILSLDFQTIHWVYVKRGPNDGTGGWRRKGIGRSLVPKYPVYASHLTVLGKDLLSKFDNCVFNPFAIGE